MAYVKIKDVHTSSHLIQLEAYAKKEKKTNNGAFLYYNELCDSSKTFLQNCNDTANKFHKKIKNESDSDTGKKNIIAHQIFQSFKRDEKITPEQIFEISQEYAAQALPGYKYFVATHIDAENTIHTHIVFDAVNSITGEKFHGNTKSIAVLRKISDDICRKYNLPIIEPKNNYKSIDKTTYEMAKQGKSWKVQLGKDLLQILPNVKSMDDFYNQLVDKNYEVKITPKNITVKKIGEKKSIRLDTFANQFGNEFCKTNIEKRIAENCVRVGHNSENEEAESNKTNEQPRYVHTAEFDEKNTEFQKLQRSYFNSHAAKKPISMPKYMFGKTKVGRIFMCLSLLFKPKQNIEHLRYIPPVSLPRIGSLVSQLPKHIGNIPYNVLLNTYGDNCTIIVSDTELEKIATAGVFYTGQIRDNKIYITFKQINSDIISAAIGKQPAQFMTQKELATERYIKRQFRSKATNGEKIMRTIGSREDILALERSNIDFSYARYGDKYNILYFEPDMQQFCSICDRKIETEQARQFMLENRHNYSALKKQAADSNEKLQYRVIDSNGIKLLKQKGTFRVAVFEKKDEQDKYNCCFALENKKDWEILFSSNQKQQTR